MPPPIQADTAEYCFLDIDLGGYREQLGLAASFCQATDTRYGLSSPDLWQLGGSEVARLAELMAEDHEWSSRYQQVGIQTKPPAYGSRVIVQLFWDKAPLACENFATLCAAGQKVAGEKTPPIPTGTSGKPLTYRKSSFHRIVPGFVAQGGDFVFGNGSGGEAALGGKPKFKDEKGGLVLLHDRAGCLSMGNSGKNSNTSQFFFTLDKAPQCNGKHVIFGKLVSGMSVLRAMEAVGTPSSGEPQQPVVITDCGLYRPLQAPGAGCWYDKPDPEAYEGISPVFLGRPRVALVAPNETALERFVACLGSRASVEVSIVLESVDAAVEQIQGLLESFAVDVVLVAPACSKSILDGLSLPSSWTSQGLALSQVVLVTKPVQALSCIISESWLQKHVEAWHLDDWKS